MEPRPMAEGARLSPTSSPPAQPQAVVAGHVCLDLIPLFDPAAEAPPLTPGTLVNVGPAMRSTGGAVSNTGVAMHRLGTPVTLMAKVGDDLFGGEVLRLLRDRDPRLTAAMAVTPGEATSYSIVLSPPGVDRTFLHCPGANDTFGPEDMRWDETGGARLLHFGYPPIMRRMQGGGEAMGSIFEEARRRGMATSLDFCGIDPSSPAARVDWPAWFARVLPSVDFFLPSHDEIAAALSRDGSRTPAEGGSLHGRAAAMADRLIHLGAAVVVLKLGDRGLLLRTTGDRERLARVGGGLLRDHVEAWLGRELASPCFEARVVGTTGAGDCTIAGFLAAVLRSASPEAALESACAVGACSVEAADATGGIPPWADVEERLDSGWRRVADEPPAGWRAASRGHWIGPRDPHREA